MAGRNYAAGQPVGNNQMLINIQTPAPFKAVAQYYKSNGSASSVVTLTQDTTAVEVAAQGTSALIRWVSVADGTGANSSVTSANYDHVIPTGQVRRFVVPIEVNNPQGYGSMVGANIENGLFRRLAFKSEGVGSVFTSEYGSSNSY